MLKAFVILCSVIFLIIFSVICLILAEEPGQGFWILFPLGLGFATFVFISIIILNKLTKQEFKISKSYLKYFSISIVLLGLFYWFQWRPSQIRKNCNEEVVQRIKEDDIKSTYYDLLFKVCLNKNGL